jgi:hypothetical protein
MREIFNVVLKEWTGESYEVKGFSQFILVTKYFCSDQIKEHEIGGACSMHGEQDRILVGKFQGRRPLRRLRRRWEDNIEMKF